MDSQAMLHDQRTWATERIAVAADGGEADEASDITSVSQHGRLVAFTSRATNIHPSFPADDVPDHPLLRDVHIYARDRGPATGVGNVSATYDEAADTVEISGWAGFTGSRVSSAGEDTVEETPFGLLFEEVLDRSEVTGAHVASRPEQASFLFSLGLASNPEQTTTGSQPVVYEWTFAVEDEVYEIRADYTLGFKTRAFSLHACEAEECTKIADLRGHLGGREAEVNVEVPYALLGLQGDTELTNLTARTMAGLPDGMGAVAPLYEVALPDPTVPMPSLELGIADASASEEDVIYEHGATLDEGHFTKTLDVSSLAPGDYNVWAKACLGDECGARSVGVSL